MPDLLVLETRGHQFQDQSLLVGESPAPNTAALSLWGVVAQLGIHPLCVDSETSARFAFNYT